MHLAGRLIESITGTRAFRAVLIAPGRSKNGIFYAPEMLREAVAAGLFEGRPVHVFAKVDADGRPLKQTHVKGSAVGRTTLNVVGVIRETRYVEGQGVVGDVTFLAGDPDADAVVDKLSRLEEAKGLDAVGLSIDAGGDVDPRSGWGRLRSVTSVDVVTDPAAGGRVLHRLAADTTTGAFPAMKTILEFARSKHPRLVEGLSEGATEFGFARHVGLRAKSDASLAVLLATAIAATGEAQKRLTECAKDLDVVELMDYGTQFFARMREGYEAEVAPKATKTPGGDDPSVNEAQRLFEAAQRDNQVLRTELRLTEALSGSGLPAAAAARVRGQFAGQVADEAKIARAIADERSYVDGLVGSAARAGAIRVTEDKADKLTGELAYMFGGGLIRLAEGERHQPYHGSFNEFLRKKFAFDVRDVVAFGGAANRRMAEDLDATNFTKVFADAANRVVLVAYQSDPQRQDWRKIVKFVPVNDFRTQHRITMGYYSTLPTVAKGASYQQLTTPTDREETYALAKKGGLESVTMEDMLNDDLGAWQELFRRIGIAANDTAYEAVFAQIRDATQATLAGDSKTLTDSTRSPANEGTAALTADATGKTNFITAIRGMAAATGGSGTKKGLTPRFLIVPLEKAEAASYVLQALAGGNTGTEIGNVLTVLKAAVPELVIDYGTSNTTDWYLMADPMRAPVLEFASLGGRTEPEIVVADGAMFGNMFLRDKLDLKVRYIFQVAPVDFAGIYGNDAAS